MDLHIKSGDAYKAFSYVSVPHVRHSKTNVIVSVIAVAIFTLGQKPTYVGISSPVPHPLYTPGHR